MDAVIEELSWAARSAAGLPVGLWLLAAWAAAEALWWPIIPDFAAADGPPARLLRPPDRQPARPLRTCHGEPMSNDDVERLLAARQPRIAALTRTLCALVLAVYPDAVVTVDGGDIGFGSGTGYKGLAFVVTPHGGHVTLGIAQGADLPDPAGLMEGSGRVHRHVKIRQAGDLERPELRQLLTAALRRNR